MLVSVCYSVCSPVWVAGLRELLGDSMKFGMNNLGGWGVVYNYKIWNFSSSPNLSNHLLFVQCCSFVNTISSVRT